MKVKKEFKFIIIVENEDELRVIKYALGAFSPASEEYKDIAKKMLAQINYEDNDNA